METRVCTWTGLCFSLFPLVTFVAQIAVLARAGLVLTEHSRSLSPRPGQGPLNSAEHQPLHLEPCLPQLSLLSS